MGVAVVLRPDRAAPRRPFTSPKLTERDLGILTAMLEDLRSVMYGRLGPIVPYRKVTRRVYGLQRYVIVCNPGPLLALDRLFVTGFFAERHGDVDVTELNVVNKDVIRQFPNYPGILSYTCWELSTDNWVNFIVTDRSNAAELWRSCPAHRAAVDNYAARHYRNLRIHSGHLPRGLGGGRGITLDRTKYWDYESGDGWHAVRELRPAAV